MGKHATSQRHAKTQDGTTTRQNTKTKTKKMILENTTTRNTFKIVDKYTDINGRRIFILADLTTKVISPHSLSEICNKFKFRYA